MEVLDIRHSQARQMRNGGMTYTAIASMFGVDTSTIHYWTDPEYRERRCTGAREYKQRMRAAFVEIDSRYVSRYGPGGGRYLPTLAFVPGIVLTSESRYQMEAK